MTASRTILRASAATALILVMALGLGTPASANDSVAELGTGGLVLGRSDVIRMAKEDLFISMDEVRIDYVFRNEADSDITTLVAFPLPDITMEPYDLPAIPDGESDNFLGFSVEVEGEAIVPQLQQRAMFRGVDITDRLLAAGLKPYAHSADGAAALEALGGTALEELLALGAVTTYDDGTGKAVLEPAWTLASAYYWTMTFPAKADIAVHHRYKPSVGGTAGVYFLPGGSAGDEVATDYARRYCTDAGFVAAVAKRLEARTEDGPWYSEARIEYVLTTGANWSGSIGEFTLTIDKGSVDNMVSFCGSGVEKTGPTTFRMRETDFWPTRELEILFIVKGGA